jgi:hypothetical protein
MTYLIQRYSDNRDSTLGLLLKVLETAQGQKTVLQAYTLEDEYRDDKVMKETRIPAGTYMVDIQKGETPLTLKYRGKYPWFKHHLEIKNVPGFKGVYIHIGNFDENTDGCILLGDIADNNVISPGSVMKSTEAFRRFYEFVYPHLPITLIIKDEKSLLTQALS